MSQGEYYQAVYNLEVRMKDESHEMKSRIWNEVYCELSQPLILEELPLSLALIHKNFWINHRGEDIDVQEEGWGEEVGRDCHFYEITKTPCPWNDSINLRSPLAHDHRWPNSLGGPKSGYNLLWLCETHNLAKGNGLWGFDWSEVPMWLDGQIKKIREQKLIGLDSYNSN